MKARRIISSTIVAALVLISYGPAASAQTQTPAPQQRGVTVAPAFSTVQVGSKQPQAEFSVGVRNDFDSPITLNASLSGLAVRQNSLIPGNDPESILNTSTTISPNFLQLKPKESINIKVTVKDSPELSPGGHYMSLLIRQISADPRQVAIEPAISTTVYVIKEDGAIRKLGVEDVVVKRSLFSLPKYVDIAYKNQGNVALIPRGAISITKGGGDTNISQGIINDRSIPLFQSEGIRIRTDLTEYHKPRLPGRYKLTIQYRYENQDDYQTATVVFWYIPKAYPLSLIVILLLTIYLAPRRRRTVIVASIGRIQARIRKSPTKTQKHTKKTPKSSKNIQIIEHQESKKSTKKSISVAATDDDSETQKVAVKRRKK